MHDCRSYDRHEYLPCDSRIRRDRHEYLPCDSKIRRDASQCSWSACLLALQGVTVCPFRVVDEINQGMDQIYERQVPPSPASALPCNKLLTVTSCHADAIPLPQAGIPCAMLWQLLHRSAGQLVQLKVPPAGVQPAQHCGRAPRHATVLPPDTQAAE